LGLRAQTNSEGEGDEEHEREDARKS
jgi:hypothetical protein